jgi:drug/metabolite transporter (DMT)-like permease
MAVLSAPTDTRPLTGILWMVVTGLCFVGVQASVKALGPGVPAPQAAFLRFLFGLVIVLPLWRGLRATRLDRRDLGWFAARGVVHTVGVICWFYAMTRITLAEVTAMNYLAPVYVTLGAALFLGERLAARRIVAVAAALLGALIILRPGLREVGPGHLAMLVTGLALGASYLIAKQLSGRFGADVVVALLSLTVTVGLAPFALAVWVPVGARELALLALVAAFATAGHYTMVLAFRAAPVSVTQPVAFLQLVWAVALGAVVFGEPVDGFVVLGGAVIVGAISFIAWREARARRRAVTPTPMQIKG